MRVVAGSAERGPVISSAVLVSALAVLALTIPAGLPLRHVAPVVILAVVAAIGYRVLLRWEILVAAVVLVILFIPIRRYVLPGDLPFEFEPYRLVVALVAASWITSLLIDPRVRLRGSGFEGPLLLFAAAALGSIIVNPGRVSAVEPEVVKEVMFLVSFIVLFYLIASVARKSEQIDFLVKVLVAGGAVVAAFALIESRTDYNIFNHFAGVVPLLDPLIFPDPPMRGARLRVYAS